MLERNIPTTPIPVRKSVRTDEWRGLTSVKAGVINPIAFFPLLREDRLRGRLMCQVKMAEAVQVIVNPIKINVSAYLIPKIALPRFNGSMETLNRSYMGEMMPDGTTPAPAWFVQETGIPQGDTGHAIYDKLGVHYSTLTVADMNTDLVESYNVVVNWRRAPVSDALAPYNVLDKTLKPAFWDAWRFENIKPSFDAAMMEGAVPVEILSEQTRVFFGQQQGGNAVLDHTQALRMTTNAITGSEPTQYAVVNDADGAPTYAGMYVNATGQGSISLANIELARQTQAFAKLRERFAGLPDEYLTDLLMQGIRVPPEDFREPILLGRATGVINQQERYATDGASLDVSVSNGVAQIAMTLNTPEVNTGGMVIVTMEIVPEQLYERVEDYALKYVAGGNAEHLPNYLRDYLDPQKVEVVPNAYADQFHSDPTGIFGYAPLNHRWNRSFARVGGRYKRPVPDAFIEERQRIWAVEKADPDLSADFYVCPVPFPHTPFADQEADPFEVLTVGMVEIVGNTVMGAPFMEDSNSYDKVMASVDQERISSEPSGGTTAAADAVIEEVSE